MPATATVNQTSDPYINGLLGSARWASGNLTFSFPAVLASYEVPYGNNEPLTNFSGLNSSQQNAARAAFVNFAAVANLSFTEIGAATAGTATLRLAMSDKPSTAWGYFPSPAAEGGDVWFNRSSGAYNNPVQGNYAYTTFLHEIGHALGLKHPQEGRAMPADRDSMEFTVMSYRSYVGQSGGQGYVNETWGFAQSLMMYDIAAIQSQYGANFSTNSGNTIYTWSTATGQMFINGQPQGTAPGANRIFMTVWDGGGADTYDFSNYTTDLTVDLRPGAWTTTSAAQLARLSYDGAQIADGNIANALQFNGDARSLIENAIGGRGNDRITGNDAGNAILGGRGNDQIDGGGGLDTASFAGIRSQYTLVNNSGVITVTDSVAGRDGIDTLTRIERLAFSDRTIDVSAVPSNAGFFSAPHPASDTFVVNTGWSSEDGYTRLIGDVNGDGRADIVAFGQETAYTAFGNINGSFGTPLLAIDTFVPGTGWVSQDRYPRLLGDVNGDGRDDIVAFGQDVGYVSFARADGTFAQPVLATDTFVAGTGWVSQDRYPRQLADVNGDGRADIVAFGQDTGYVAFGVGNGTFGQPVLATATFVAGTGWVSQDRYPRLVADVNGDGRADIVGFGQDVAYVALGDGTGRFGAPAVVSDTFVVNTGWISQDRVPRLLGDVNGDGRADIVGFGDQGVFVAHGTADGRFGAVQYTLSDFGPAKGWSGQNVMPRILGDANADGASDIIGFGTDRVYVSTSLQGPAPANGPAGDQGAGGAAAPYDAPQEASDEYFYWQSDYFL